MREGFEVLVTTAAETTVATRENQQELVADGSYGDSFRFEVVGCVSGVVVDLIIQELLLLLLLLFVPFHSEVVPFQLLQVRKLERVPQILRRP